MTISYEFRDTNGPERVVPVSFFKKRPLKFFDSDNFAPTSGMRRFLGVEIEVSGLRCKPDLPRPLGNWYTAQSDKVQSLNDCIVFWNCSVAPDAYGFEIQTSPSQGANFTAQISEICTTLAESQALLSPNCGLHVHADMRDIDLQGLRRLVVFYANFEKTLLKTQPPKRIFKGPCFPVGRNFAAGYSTGTLRPTLYLQDGSAATSLDEILTNKIRHGKYLSINLEAYREHQTIEIRMHEGTINPNEIIPWAVGIGAIVDAVKRMSLKEIENLRPGMAALKEIMPKEAYDYISERRKTYSDTWTDDRNEELRTYNDPGRWTY